MDVLSEILDHLRLRGTLYFSTSFSRPWGVRVPRFRRVARFQHGGAWQLLGRRRKTEPGSISRPEIWSSCRTARSTCSQMVPESPTRTVDEVVERAGFTGTGALIYGGDADPAAPTRLICGHFEFDERFGHPLLAQLPPALVIRWSERRERAALEQMFTFMSEEVEAGRPGHEAVVRRLSEVLFVQAVRFWAETAEPTGVLRALADPRLAPALQAIHADPADRWTLDRLARKAALGRSAFAARFREAMGTTPHRYLTEWRLQGARRLLAESNLSLERIAIQTGYDSAASFSRAFSRDMGTSPGAYRRAARRMTAARAAHAPVGDPRVSHLRGGASVRAPTRAPGERHGQDPRRRSGSGAQGARVGRSLSRIRAGTGCGRGWGSIRRRSTIRASSRSCRWGFCYPGTGSSGDLPPRRECAPAWRAELLEHLSDVRLTLVLGSYALRYHLPDTSSVTAAVRAWRTHWPDILPLPHPSPRNTGWFRRHPWFEAEVVPHLRARVRAITAGAR